MYKTIQFIQQYYTLYTTIVYLLDYSLFFIENKCLSNAMWDLKREPGSIASKSTHLTVYPTETNAELASFLLLTNPITR